jgi:hypothetical protein
VRNAGYSKEKARILSPGALKMHQKWGTGLLWSIEAGHYLD